MFVSHLYVNVFKELVKKVLNGLVLFFQPRKQTTHESGEHGNEVGSENEEVIVEELDEIRFDLDRGLGEEGKEAERVERKTLGEEFFRGFQLLQNDVVDVDGGSVDPNGQLVRKTFGEI